MEAEPRPLLPDLAAALAQWRRRGRLADLLPPLLAWSLARGGAERAILASERPDGGYRVLGSRTADGETIPDAEKGIAHFAVDRASGGDAPLLFPDTRADRRFRTEAERERGLRSRSILVAPLSGVSPRAFLYLDSRFRVIDAPASGDLEWRALVDLIATGLACDEERRRLRELERRLPGPPAVGESAAAAAPARSARPRRPSLRAGAEIDFHGFITRSEALAEKISELRRLAPSGVPVLIEGESGTGKELLARAIHVESGRRGPFVTLHCGTIPETLVEVELFGHRAGAFTGAERDRPGLLAHTEGGTLFLDAIDEASPTLQGALLRVLETGRYRPLAADAEVAADVRIISATLDADPSGARRDDPLRLDLYYRLAGARVRVPPLRQRREDILPIVSRLLARAAGGGSAPELSEDVEAELLAHDWPGNVREVENLARRTVALGAGTLTAERFRELVGLEVVEPRPEGEMRGAIERAEREVILRAIAEAGGNKSVACALLGMSRRTLYRRMQKHGIPL